MDPSIKTQLDIKNNAEDLQRFLAEMKTWEQEIKEKELNLTGAENEQNKSLPLPRNIAKKRATDTKDVKEKKKIAAYDYKAWDKFDVDKACREIDGEESVNNFMNSSDDEEEDLLPLEKKREDPPVKRNSTLKEKEVKENPKPVDKKQISSSEDEERQKLINIDLAYFEKELGNKLVKQEKWQDALQCYSKAIDLDPENAIYHANRALCYIKLSNFKTAEVDSTIAIQLDKTYVKAFQRRAFARKALQQFQDAKADYEQILKLEPKNALARVEINKIDEYLAKPKQTVGKEVKPTFNPKNMFGSNPKVKKVDVKIGKELIKTTEAVTKQKENQKLAEAGNAESRKTSERFNPLPSEFTLVQPVSTSPHHRSKMPLRKVEVKQVDDRFGLDRLLSKTSSLPVNLKEKDENEPLKEIPAPTVKEVTPVQVKKVETTLPVTEEQKITEVPSTEPSEIITVHPVPKTCVQFELAWKTVFKSPALAYRFLKSIPTPSLPSIFGSSLESNLLSDLIGTVSRSPCLEDAEFIFEFLSALTNVERFTSLVLFMSSNDEEGIKRCSTRLTEVYGTEKVTKLLKLWDQA